MPAPAKAFIQKPWDDDVLLALVGRLLGQPGSFDEFESIPVWDADETATPLGG